MNFFGKMLIFWIDFRSKFIDDNERSNSKRCASVSSQLGSSLDDENKRSDGGNSGNSSNSLDIKQERMENSLINDDETNSLCSGERPFKKSKIDVVDAESNTINSGKYKRTSQFY